MLAMKALWSAETRVSIVSAGEVASSPNCLNLSGIAAEWDASSRAHNPSAMVNEVILVERGNAPS